MSDRKRQLISIAMAFVAAVSSFGCSSTKPPSAFEQDFDDDTKTWKEIQTQLPAAPREEDLMGFGVSGASSYYFAIDRKSLAIGSDGVFRYTLVATSPQGARNVSYEGIRCATREKKIYAIGQSDGTWTKARNAAWARIVEVGNNRQHAALMKEYFCPDGTAQQKMSDVLDRFKRRLPTTIL